MQIPVKGGAVLSGACVPPGADAGCYASPPAPLVWENLGVNEAILKKGATYCAFSALCVPPLLNYFWREDQAGYLGEKASLF